MTTGNFTWRVTLTDGRTATVSADALEVDAGVLKFTAGKFTAGKYGASAAVAIFAPRMWTSAMKDGAEIEFDEAPTESPRPQRGFA
jgi:hypothetical protein